METWMRSWTALFGIVSLLVGASACGGEDDGGLPGGGLTRDAWVSVDARDASSGPVDATASPDSVTSPEVSAPDAVGGPDVPGPVPDTSVEPRPDAHVDATQTPDVQIEDVPVGDGHISDVHTPDVSVDDVEPSQDTPDPGEDVQPDTSEPPAEPCTRFARSPIEWMVPSDEYKGVGGMQTYSVDDIYFSWAVIDLDGDGLLDLVSISEEDIAAGRWSFHKNNGGGFDFVARPWSIPGDVFTTTSYTLTWSISEIAESWATVDMDGDKKPDLVHVTEDSAAGKKWLVYKNTGRGFASSPTRWTIPDPKFMALGWTSMWSISELAESWATFDIDGDGLPDLVHCDDELAAERTWHVYENTGSGFERAPTSWSIPNDTFIAAGWTFTGSYSYPRDSWATVDMDDDGLPDLLHADESTENTPRWKLYRNTGSGFEASAHAWAVPDTSFRAIGFTTTGSYSLPSDSWATMDMDGDRLPDLVFVDDDLAEEERWTVWRNTGERFAASGSAWPVPSSDFEAIAFTIYGSYHVPEKSWAPLDMNADGCPDLVDAIPVESSGKWKWRVYLAE